MSLWSSGHFGVGELASTLLLLRMYQNVDLAKPKVFAICC